MESIVNHVRFLSECLTFTIPFFLSMALISHNDELFTHLYPLSLFEKRGLGKCGNVLMSAERP